MTQPPTPQWDPQAGRWVLPEQGAPQGYGGQPPGYGQGPGTPARGQYGQAQGLYGQPQGQHGQAQEQQAWSNQQVPGYAPPGQGYGQPSGQWPPQPPRAPAKKRKKWPFVVGGIVLLIIIIAVNSGGGSTAPSTPAAGSSPETSTAAEASGDAPIRLEATSSRGGLLVSYSVGSGGFSSNSVDSPWSQEFPAPEEAFSISTFSVTNDPSDLSGRSVTITCKVTQGGQVLKQNTASGQFASADCSGF